MSRTVVTPEITGNARGRRVLGLLAAMVAFLVISNATALVMLRRHPVNRTDWLIREKWRLLDDAPQVETLILGDSSCNQGIDPLVLERAVGGSSLNLCTVGNMLAVGDAWMLSEYLRLHGRPRRVLIVHVYDAWARSTGHSFAELLGKVERPWGYWRKLEPIIEVDSSVTATSRWLPLLTENKSIWRLLQAPVRGFPPAFHLDRRSGFMKVDAANSARVVEDARSHLDELSQQAAEHRPLISDENRRALLALSALSAREQVDITIAPAPIFEGLWSHPEVQQRYAELVAAIRHAAGSDARVRVIGKPPITFAANQMENVDHVVGEAAVEYTRWLVSAMASP